MEHNHTEAAASGKRTFTLPAQILFCLAVCLFSFISAINPMGIVGIPLAILAAALLTLLACSYSNPEESVRLKLLPGAAILPYAAAAIALQSPALALPALFPLAMALPIWLTLRMRLGRAASIAGAAGCSMLLWLVYFALAIAAEYGACNAETVGIMLDEALAPVKEMLSGMTRQTEEGTMPLYTQDSIETMLYFIKTLLLGTLAAMMIVISYFTTLAARLIAGLFGVSALLPSGMRICMRASMTEDGPKVEIFRDEVPWRIEIDSVTAGVYIAAYVISALLSFADNAMTLYSALQNLVIILTPGFFYCGLRDAILGLRGKSSIGGISMFSVIFAAFLLFVNPSSLLWLISALGVMVTLRENRMKRMREQNLNGKEG